MRLTETLFITFIALFLFIGVPFPHHDDANAARKGLRQEQQEAPSDRSDTFVVVFRSTNASQEETADISWLKKAAELGVKNNLPYFNVMEQNSYKSFSKKADTELTTIEGTVEFTNDPMSTDYDAHEILSLIPEE
jgi:hypothetical protein